MFICKRCGLANFEEYPTDRGNGMLSTEIKVELLDERAKLPEYASLLSAGMDAFACLFYGDPGDGNNLFLARDEIVIPPGETALVCLGFRVELQEGWFLDVRPRSGISLNTPLRIANAPGTIDTDYKGVVHAIVYNSSQPELVLSDEIYHCGDKHNKHGSYVIRTGDKICQLVPQKHYKAAIVEGKVNQNERNRGGGMGSSGI